MLVPFLAVKEWRIDGDRRIPNKTTGRYVLMNYTNMFEIHSISTGSWFYFFDNIADTKDGGAYVKTTTTVANIILNADKVPWHNTIPLKVYPNEDINEITVDTVVNLSDISYIYDHENDGLEAAYVYYREGGWDLKRVLVNNTTDEIYAYFAINAAL